MFFHKTIRDFSHVFLCLRDYNHVICTGFNLKRSYNIGQNDIIMT